MNPIISEAAMLYGTDEAVKPRTSLTAGPLTAQFDDGSLRYIKIFGKEAIRNIAFVVRDKDWGTCQPELSQLTIDQRSDGFTISFEARCVNGDEEILYSSHINADESGALSFSTNFQALNSFLTNRTGFVVLHPLEGVTGERVTVETVNGDIFNSVFPELIDPLQPFKEIRSLTHQVLPEVSICCRMMGDTFEMEDQRQWNDASYKTYVRPIALPWPYTIAGDVVENQEVTLTITKSAAYHRQEENTHVDNVTLITVENNNTKALIPQLGIGLEPEHLRDAIAHQNELKTLAPQQLIIWHELAKHDVNNLIQAKQLALFCNTTLVLHAIIPDDNYKSELTQLAALCTEAELTLTSISVTPAIYLQSITPGASWPDVTALADLYDEVRHHFPHTRIGGGMLAFFPELNRHRPPIEHLDYITHASNTITHAADDNTAAENLETLPHIIRTCRSFCGNTPYHVGPSSIAMRFNPYGSKTMDNANNQRIAMARMDPRQRGLFNAAWTIGYLAHMAREGIQVVNMHAPTGEFGLIYHPQKWSQPGFDDSSRIVYPAFHVFADIARAAGLPQLTTHSSCSAQVQALAYIEKGKHVVWVANLTSEVQDIDIKGLNTNELSTSEISLESFSECTKQLNPLPSLSQRRSNAPFKLGPYASIRLST